jgi:hypothetical protein
MCLQTNLLMCKQNNCLLSFFPLLGLAITYSLTSFDRVWSRFALPRVPGRSGPLVRCGPCGPWIMSHGVLAPTPLPRVGDSKVSSVTLVVLAEKRSKNPQLISRTVITLNLIRNQINPFDVSQFTLVMHVCDWTKRNLLPGFVLHREIN